MSKLGARHSCPVAAEILLRYNVAADRVERDRVACTAILREYDVHVDTCGVCRRGQH